MSWVASWAEYWAEKWGVKRAEERAERWVVLSGWQMAAPTDIGSDGESAAKSAAHLDEPKVDKMAATWDVS